MQERVLPDVRGGLLPHGRDPGVIFDDASEQEGGRRGNDEAEIVPVERGKPCRLLEQSLVVLLHPLRVLLECSFHHRQERTGQVTLATTCRPGWASSRCCSQVVPDLAGPPTKNTVRRARPGFVRGGHVEHGQSVSPRPYPDAPDGCPLDGAAVVDPESRDTMNLNRTACFRPSPSNHPLLDLEALLALRDDATAP